MAPKSETHMSHEFAWIQERYLSLKKETELKTVVRRSWTVKMA